MLKTKNFLTSCPSTHIWVLLIKINHVAWNSCCFDTNINICPTKGPHIKGSTRESNWSTNKQLATLYTSKSIIKYNIFNKDQGCLNPAAICQIHGKSWTTNDGPCIF